MYKQDSSKTYVDIDAIVVLLQLRYDADVQLDDSYMTLEIEANIIIMINYKFEAMSKLSRISFLYFLDIIKYMIMMELLI